MDWRQWNYDVVLSYSGKDRCFAQQLARELQVRGCHVFFAPDDGAQSLMAGENLPTTLSKIYQERSLLCVVLSSQHYLDSRWTRLEFAAALERSRSEADYGYLILVALDNSALPGVSGDTAFLDTREGVPMVAAAISDKVRSTVMRLRGRLHESVWVIYLAVAGLFLSPSSMLWAWNGVPTLKHIMGYTCWCAATVLSLVGVRQLRGSRLQSILRKLLVLGMFSSYMIITQVLWHPTIIMTVWYGYCIGLAGAGLWFFDAGELATTLGLPRYMPVAALVMTITTAIACAFVLYGQLGDLTFPEAFQQMLRVVLGFAASCAGLCFLWRPIVLRPRPPHDVGIP